MLGGAPGASTFTAEAGQDVELGVVVAHVDGGELHTATHALDQPRRAVDVEPLRVQVQHAVPDTHSGI